MNASLRFGSIGLWLRLGPAADARGKGGQMSYIGGTGAGGRAGVV